MNFDRESQKGKVILLVSISIFIFFLQGCDPQNMQAVSDGINGEQTNIVPEPEVPADDLETGEESENIIEIVEAFEETSEEIQLPVRTEIEVEAGREKLEAADFLMSEDEKELSIETDLTKEDLSQAGAEYEVKLRFRNQEVNALVTIIDTTPPTIDGAKDITIKSGESVSYKKDILLCDDSNGEVKLEVDSSAVNTQKAGDYPVRYIATDESGNATYTEIILHVTEPVVIDETTVGPMADKVIADVVTPDMSQYDKAYVLWNWCRNNIYYNSLAGDYNEMWRSAYQGLHDRKGSCYAFAYTYSLLLNRCGIDNMCVMRVGGTTDHIWNLVNTGNGWYHCDASPRRKGDDYLCFMQTDAQVQAYTDSYPEKPNYYTFDSSLYPERAEDIIFGN